MDMKDRLSKAYGLPADDKEGTKRTRAARPNEGQPAPAVPASRAPAREGGRDGARAAESSRDPKSRKPSAGMKAPSSSRDRLKQAAAASGDFIKTGVPGIEKAAKFLLLLGQEEAAKVLRHLKPDEIEKISREIARIDRIDTAEANHILTEFGWLLKTQGENLEGGTDTAEKMLAAAFGEDKAREVIRKAVPGSRRPFAFLAEYDARQLAVVLRDEPIQVSAVIMPYLDPKAASAFISELPEAQRTELVRRIAGLDKLAPDVIERMESALRDKIARLGRSDAVERIDGAAVLAGILKHVDGGLDQTILSGIAADDPELSRDIRERLFTVDDMLRVPDRELQRGLRDVSERDIALVLKGKSQAFRDKVLANVSQSKRTIVLEEYDILGTVRRDEADKATRSFIDYYKRKWESGDLALDGDEDLVD